MVSYSADTAPVAEALRPLVSAELLEPMLATYKKYQLRAHARTHPSSSNTRPRLPGAGAGVDAHSRGGDGQQELKNHRAVQAVKRALRDAIQGQDGEGVRKAVREAAKRMKRFEKMYAV
jgi:hypothetical protein